MSMTKASPILAATLLLPGLPSPAAAQATGLEDMVGARAGQAELEVRRRGYVDVRAEKGDDRAYTYWWNADRRQCVTIATMDGRYSSIQPTLPPDCREPASLRPNPSYAGQPERRPPAGDEPDRGSARPPERQQAAPSYVGGDAPTVDGRAVELGLVCFGDGSKAGIASGTTWTWNRDKKRYDYGRYNETTTEVFDALLMVQTWEGGGRIRLPRSLIPPINSRGNDGWWDLYDLVEGPDVIRASYRLNGLNKPKVVIDRRTGRITVAGSASYSFRGTCDTIGHEARRF
ncbi:hypothetical protein KZ813_11740 [Sphingomonas sp. RHCKR7]|uniref:hypothetical protein n=1 Tax=Sphingomonas folli TaxID=2862497 RepID=UPI001CA54575|nr:hypothetical protein [Sphingomonas folli]MBW6527512.1 hypothetical protein [Sphingomonas folli]